MAKKAVATLHEGSTDGRAYTKVIKMVKSPKTGAYMFDEKMVPNIRRLQLVLQPFGVYRTQEGKHDWCLFRPNNLQ